MAPPVKKKKKHSSADHRPISATDANQQKPLGSFMTFGKRQSVRVAMKMNRRILRKIWVCNDIWMDTLPFFGRRQLGLKLAMVSLRFNALVDKHFDGQTELTIWRPIRIEKMRTTAKLVVWNDFKCFPLPDHSLHNKIRFEDIWIRYIDHSVITFLRSNQQIFDKRGNSLDLLLRFYAKDKDVQPVWNAFAHEIWPIFAPNIGHLKLHHRGGGNLENLRRQFSPTILSDLNQLNSINSDGLLPTSIGDDGPNATDGQALSKWLHTPTKDGQPKQLTFWHSKWGTIKLVNDFKKAFLRATTSSASYIIRFGLHHFDSTEIGPFELVNEQTNEKLTLEKEDEYANGNWLLKRCQIGGTIHWKDEKTDNLNNVIISLQSGRNCIGPLSPPKADQMNPGPSSVRKSERIMAKLKND